MGFNRRFSPLTVWLKQRFEVIPPPFSMNTTVNAGRLAPDSWLWDLAQGGGRVIGEICHFIDLAQVLTRSIPVRVQAERVDGPGNDDSVVATILMDNGSISHIGYFAAGDRAHPRERVEIFGGGATGNDQQLQGCDIPLGRPVETEARFPGGRSWTF